MDLSLISIFITVAIAHFLALLSPGPDFVLVVKSALKGQRKNSIGVALGIAIANAVCIGLCLIGVAAILSTSMALMITLKVIGAMFLMYIAFNALKAPRDAYQHITAISDNSSEISLIFFLKEFFTGFLSGILNPKNLLFYLSLFTVALTADIGLRFRVFLGIWMTTVVFLWNVAIIYFLSKENVRKKFYKMIFYVDKVAGFVLIFISFGIIKSVFFEL